MQKKGTIPAFFAPGNREAVSRRLPKEEDIDLMIHNLLIFRN